MILTVTLNAALDVTYRVDALRPHHTHRVSAVDGRPGGKGVNVAAVLTQLREAAVATGLYGGPTGTAIRDGLAAAGIPDAFVTVTADSRRTLVVTDGTDATGFWEPGFTVTAADWDAFRHRYQGLLAVSRVVVLSGSLPRGLPVSAYAETVAMAREAGVPSVVDADGEVLRAALGAGPDVVKPNLAELASVTGGKAGEPDEAGEAGKAGDDAVVGAAHRLRTLGAANVVVSRGAAGLLASTVDGDFRAVPPEPVTGNPTGAGDAVAAGLAMGLAYRWAWPATLARAVALSAAAVAEPLAGRVDGTTYDRLRGRVHTEPL